MDGTTDQSAEIYLRLLERRSYSHTTGIICAECGNTTKLSNRYKSPIRVTAMDNGLFLIMFSCPKCDALYDIGSCGP